MYNSDEPSAVSRVIGMALELIQNLKGYAADGMSVARSKQKARRSLPNGRRS